MPRWAPNAETEYDTVHKIVLVGNSGVGKSSLVHRFTESASPLHGPAQAHVPTIGVDFKIRKLCVDGRIVKCHLWDTTGNERFRSITTAYYRAAHAIAVCFDTSNAASFESVASWLSAVDQFGADGVVATLIGTKSDLTAERQVSRERAELFAASKGLTYVETSALADENVQLAFETMSREAARRQKEMASRRSATLRAGGAPLRTAIANWRPAAMADAGCCCLPLTSILTTLLAARDPPPPRWSPITVSGAPALASVAVG